MVCWNFHARSLNRPGDQHLCYSLKRSKHGLLYFAVFLVYFVKLSHTLCKQRCYSHSVAISGPVGGGGGGEGVLLAVYMTWDLKYYFWVENLHAWYSFGSKNLSCIVLGLTKYASFLGDQS